MPPPRRPELLPDELSELESYLYPGPIPPELRQALDELTPETLRAAFEEMSAPERQRMLVQSADATEAGRAWARDKWRAFRAHPSWSHLMQARVAHRHYRSMRRAHEAVLLWCQRKDKRERRVARIVRTLQGLQRLYHRIFRGRPFPVLEDVEVPQAGEATSEDSPIPEQVDSKMPNAVARLCALFGTHKPESEEDALRVFHQWLRAQPGGNKLRKSDVTDADPFAVEVYRYYRREREGNAPNALQQLTDSLGRTLDEMRAKAAELGVAPEDMVLTPEGVIKMREGAKGNEGTNGEGKLEWSEAPGCFERQLQRRWRSPFFPAAMRRVTIEEVAAARQRDHDDVTELRRQALTVANDLMNLDQYAVNGAIPFSSLDRLRGRLDDVMLRAAEIGSTQADAIAANTAQMYETVHQVIANLGAEDPETRAALEKADALRAATRGFLTHPFLAQAYRSESAIGETWFVPSLLSESPETIRTVMTLLETVPDLQGEADRARRQGAQLIADLRARGELSVRESEEKLDALGVISPKSAV